MKIDNTGKSLASTATRPSASRTATSKTTEAKQGENVNINPLAARMQAEEAGATFDADKVAAIRQAIADGKFTIRADAIADKLISNVQELLQE
jgi:negative regulator of flagellin synthesis FlgM